MVKKKRSLGYGFPDQVVRIKGKISHFKNRQFLDWTESLLPNFQPAIPKMAGASLWRVTFFSVVSLILFFIIFLRLFYLQIVWGQKNKELADGNRIQIKIIHAPRGVIFDRHGKILAANSPAFRLADKETKKAKLISRDQALELEVKNDPKASDLEIDNVRTYPYEEKMAHVVGYVGEISAGQLQGQEYKNYQLGDRVGKAGIEAQYEKILRGKDGGEIIEVDSMGQKIRTLRRNPATAGSSIYLNIDSDLQDKLYQLMKETLVEKNSLSGAAVAMDPQNGQVLALVSFPSFDPNVFTSPQDESTINEIFSNPASPLLNRSLGGTYPPGSTFKIVSGLAALSSGKVTADTIFQDSGVIYLGSFKFTNWYFNQYGKTEGEVNLSKAIQRSNDTYFYQIAQIIGEDVLTSWARKLKLGGKVDIDLPAEAAGLVPDDGWKRKTLNQPWYPGDTLHMAIGQGFVLTTPLQILGITSYIAASGKLYKPQLLSKVVSGDRVILEPKPKVLISNLTTPDKVKIIKEGMKLVPKSGGTAWPFFSFPIPTGGKTGTAEFGDPKGRTHAWYTSFAPADDPKIVLTILIEGGGEGSSVAAPIAKEVYRWYFSEDKNKLIQDIYPQATDSGKTLGE